MGVDAETHSQALGGERTQIGDLYQVSPWCLELSEPYRRLGGGNKEAIGWARGHWESVAYKISEAGFMRAPEPAQICARSSASLMLAW